MSANPTANQATLNALMETLYPQSKLTIPGYNNSPFYAMVKKKTDFLGNLAQIATRYSATQGRAADFATAANNKTAASYAKWQLTRAKDYSLFNIDGETIRTARDKGAIVNGLEQEADAAMYAINRAICIDLFRNAGGARGYGDGAYSVAGTTVQLGRVSDIVNFEQNMVIRFAATDGTSGVQRVGTATIATVNRDLGQFTTTVAISTAITAPSNTDYIFQDGDFAVAKSKISGLDAWLPAIAPAPGDNFFGLDRSVDSGRLAGVRFTATNSLAGQSIEEAIQRCATRIGREGGKPDACFLNNDDMLALSLSLGTRLLYTDTKTSVGVGFKGVEVTTGSGTVTCYADPNCPQGTAFLLQMDTWCLWSAGAMPDFLGSGADGLKYLRLANADAYEGRIGYYAQLYCVAPGMNGRIAV